MLTVKPPFRHDITYQGDVIWIKTSLYNRFLNLVNKEMFNSFIYDC